MNKRTLGRTGLQVSPLGFGAAPAAFLNADQAAVASMLGQLLDSGMNVLDTAVSYPGSEEFIGRYLSSRRKDFVLISKCGGKQADIDAPAYSAPLISAQVDRSLKLLRTDIIDVMLLHTCDLPTLQKGEAIAALAEARQAGKIRFAGYSGDNEAAAFAANHPEVAVVEMSINLVDQVNLTAARPAAKRNNVGVLVKRPLANGCWRESLPGMYASYAQEYVERWQKMRLDPAELGFRGDPQKLWPEVALRFVLSQEGVHTALVGTTKQENAEANVEAARKGPLSADVVQKIRHAFRRADPKSTWKGLT